MIRIGFMRFLDKWCSGFLCRFIAVFWSIKRIFIPRASTDFPPEKVRNILVIKFFGAGSLYLAWPMFKGLRDRFKNAKIHVITFESNRQFLEIMDCVDEILAVRNDKITHFVIDMIRHWWHILFHRPDISIDLEFFSHSSVLFAMFFLARRRVGLFAENATRSDLLTIRVGFNHYRHVSEIFFELAKVIGVEHRQEFFDLKLPTMDKVYQEGVLPKLNLAKGQNYAVININSSNLFLFRRWPIEQFCDFITQFRQEHPDMPIVLVGTRAEKPYVDLLFDKLDNTDGVLNIAGELNMGELLALLENASLFLSSDSGPIHFASGYKTPTVAMFGPETPVLYSPLNQQAIVIYQQLYCSPCMNIYSNKDFKGCKDNICMSTITVQQVMNASNNLLSGKPNTLDDTYMPISRMEAIDVQNA